MEINTTRFGTIPVQEEKIITFSKGILGFSKSRRFILFPHTEGSPFFWLQCIDDGNLAFVVMNPQIVKPDYTINIEEEVLNDLKAKDLKGLDVMCIVTIPQKQPEKMTINLLGPIIINANNHSATQVVCSNADYSHQHPVITKKSA